MDMLLIAGSFTNIVAGANAVKSFVVLGLGYAESQPDERAKLYVGGSGSVCLMRGEPPDGRMIASRSKGS
ncbi:MAG: hypothetical protein P8O10_11810 [Pseudorhodobacter sp.]|nr:hypothetical protein [Pseudorhodobacter sp.]